MKKICQCLVSNPPQFEKNEDEADSVLLGLMYQKIKTVNHLSQPVTVNGVDMLENLVTANRELKSESEVHRIVDRMVRKLTYDTLLKL